MNIARRQRSLIAWTFPALLAVPFLMGADGQGCGPGGPFRTTPPVVNPPADAGSDDASLTCSPSDCDGLAAPALAKLCPDGSSVAATVCVVQDGHCGWGFPACPPGDGGSSDACTSGPCPAPTMDAEVICLCPFVPASAPKCPDGTTESFSHGPPPCECEGLAPCPVVDAGDAGYAGDGGGACTANSDCPAGYQCGFPESEGCSATGTCSVAPTVTCEAYAAGCACDGSEINLACNGLPSGYAPKPLNHTGACTTGI